MAQVYNCRLTRNDPSCSWGFRLQGGKDFGTPLLIQKVNAGSLAERAGLQVGDAVLRVNNKDVSNERHKDAQETIIRAGNSFEITIQRDALGTWRPAVTPVGAVPSPNPYNSMSPSPVTKTSLAAANNRGQSPRIPHGFNSSMKPFSPHMNGGYENGNGPVKAIVNKQYNSPVGIYSDESIAETLSAQAEVLAGGVLGVNFKKNEKDYNPDASEVYKMLQEAEREPKSTESDTNGVSSPIAGLRHVSPPKTTNSTPSSESSLTPGKNICAECERLIVGVFVRIKEKNLHVECFKCATCGTSLKNVGYYSVNNKLYCDIHAKMVAKQNPPVSNHQPVSVSPFQGGAAKPFKPLSPQPSLLTPAPFHSSRLSPTRTISPLQSQNPANFNGTVPFKPLQTNNTSAFRPGAATAGSNSSYKYTNGSSAAGVSAPRRGKGVWNAQGMTVGARIPLCAHCNSQVRGPFVTALEKIWCPEHFVCVSNKCGRSLLDIGFVEEPTGLYCEYCFEQYLAPQCGKCYKKIKGDCLNGIGKHFHPECFTCAYCGKLFGNSPFFLEEGMPYCENDWNELFTTKCFACGFPIEAGDRWVEAMKNNYHSPCFNCTTCQTNLEGQSFYAKGGRPFCKNHSR